jgi:glucose-1-phosphate thymidylyltransferase
VKVIIPLAGKGTRLRPHTYTTPKPLLRVGGRPVMSYILDDLRELGVNEAVFITGYLKERSRSTSPRVSRLHGALRRAARAERHRGAVQLAEPYVDRTC